MGMGKGTRLNGGGMGTLGCPIGGLTLIMSTTQVNKHEEAKKSRH